MNNSSNFSDLLPWQKYAYDVIQNDISSLDTKKKIDKIGTFIVGPPGTGKSFLVETIVKDIYNKYSHLKISICATTGAAASRLKGGKTLASWLQIGAEAMKLDKYDEVIRALKNKQPRSVIKTDILILDEVSMLSQRQFENLNSACSELRKNPIEFGGMYIILIGDPMQLPPIPHDEGKGLGRWKTEFIPSCLERYYRAFNYVVANEMKRSEDSSLLQQLLLSIISSDKNKREKAIKLLLKVCYKEEMELEEILDLQKNTGSTILTTAKEGEFSVTHYNILSEQYNDNVSEINISPAIKVHDSNNEELLKRIGGQKALIAEEESLEKRDCWPKDDKVRTNIPFMIRMNFVTPEDIKVYNGDIGEVRSYNSISKTIEFYLYKNKKIITIPLYDFKSEWEPEISYRAFPLIQASAMTVHKAQGATLTSGIILETRRIYNGEYLAHMLYTALSRVKKIEDIRITSFITHTMLELPSISNKLDYVWKLPYMEYYLKPSDI